MPHAPLDHTADTGLEAAAGSLVELITELATGMFELMARVECHPARTIETEVRADSRDDLVVDTLSELLYLSETEDLHFCQFTVSATDEHSIHVAAAGVPLGDVGLTGPPIKAVTYHGLEIAETDDGWSARVYFDV